MTAPPIAEIENLTFRYDEPPVLQDVTLRIDPGDFVCILGPNGGGKTTLLNLMLGLLTPESGAVRLFGASPEQTRKRVGYMSQNAQLDLRFPITVQSVALMGRLGLSRRIGPFRHGDYQLAREALEQVGLKGLEKRSFAALSGGQRQRLLIARALVTQPELLILDEPTSNLDLQGEAEFVELLKRLNRRMTIVLVSHDVGFVSAAVNRVFCVNRRVTSHPTSEITPQLLQDLFGGSAMHVVQHHHKLQDGRHA